MPSSKHPERPPARLGVAEEVQSFYERYPYPRPADDLDNYGRTWNDRKKRMADFHLFWPNRSYREDFSILVAGCGTSQAAKYAMRWPLAKVTGIDFSATSLRSTEDLKRKYGLKNLQVRQLAVERAGELEMSFDQIVCTGVLHHLVDPDAGLSACAVCSARTGRCILWCTRLMDEPEFTCCRSSADGSASPLRTTRFGTWSLRSECCRRVIPWRLSCVWRRILGMKRNLPMLCCTRRTVHIQCLSSSIFFAKPAWHFGRWTRQAPYSSRCGVIANLPQAERMAQLSLDELYAAVELFRGTMVRHSAVVYRDEGSANSAKGRLLAGRVA